MTSKKIPNNSLCQLYSAKLRSHTINNIQPLSLSSLPILTKKVYHITAKFPTNPPEQVYTTILTSISPSHDNHSSKLANEICNIPNLINQKTIIINTSTNNVTISSLFQTDTSRKASKIKT